MLLTIDIGNTTVAVGGFLGPELRFVRRLPSDRNMDAAACAARMRTLEEYRKTNRSIWNETDSQAQSGTWYCVEGSCQHLRQILKGNKFMGGILVDQFYDNPAKLSETIEMDLRRSGSSSS